MSKVDLAPGFVDLRRFDNQLDGLAEAFASAYPFPHVVLDDVFGTRGESLADDFPDDHWEGWTSCRTTYEAGKRYCGDLTLIPPRLQQLIIELSQPAFLHFLEQVTGITRLLPDPYLEGGGLHASGTGGTLAPHTDFHVYERLGLYRRVNVLLYLNPEWNSAWGGSLELFEPGSYERPVESIVPTLGRMVMFRTDDRSPHGFTTPVASGRCRRSVALYYYTAAESTGFAGDTNTYWKTHGRTGGAGKARMAAYRSLLLASRGFAMLANRSNPNIDGCAPPRRQRDSSTRLTASSANEVSGRLRA